MTNEERRLQVVAWNRAGVVAFETAKALYTSGDYRGTVNRAYYAVYNMCAGAAVAHGDETSFPLKWSNPSHDQLPGLIDTNGDLSVTARAQIVRNLGILRREREVADYKPWRTVEGDTVLKCLSLASTVIRLVKG